MEPRNNQTYIETERHLQNGKGTTDLHKIKEVSHLVKKLRSELERKNIEIHQLRSELNKERNFSCEHVFHSYVVYKGTDIIAPCDCRRDYTNFLPNELLLEIFSYFSHEFLEVCAEVCMRWKEISLDRSLWRKTKLNGRVINMRDIDNFIALGPKQLILTEMEVLDYPSDEDDDLDDEGYDSSNQFISKTVHDNWNELKTLEMHRLCIENHVLSELLWKCSKITSLAIHYRMTSLTIDTEICNIIGYIKNLRSLKLTEIDLDLKDLKIIFNNCTNLEEVDLSETGDWQYESPLYFPSQLKKLILKEVFYRRGANEKLKQIIQMCPNLTTLNIDYCDSLTPSAIYHISSFLPKLQFLSLRGNDNLNHNLSVLKNISTLEEICMTCEKDDMDPTLQMNLRNVKISVTCTSDDESDH